jgi:HlyD family secretion protein
MKQRWVLLGLVVVVIVVLAIWKAAQPDARVAVVGPQRGLIRAYVEEQAVTELPHDTLVSMPIAGWLQQIALREGDPVRAEQVVARLETGDLADRVHQAEQRIAVLQTRIEKAKDHRLEHNALKEIEATVQAFDQTVEASQAKLGASQAILDFARSEIDRLKRIAEGGTAAVAPRELRQAETEMRRARAEYQSDGLELAALKTLQAVSYIGPKFMRDYIDRKSFELAELERQLAEAQAQCEIEKRNLARAEIQCPVNGIVLERHQTRRQYLGAGTPLLTIGDLDAMEVVADVLTERATRIVPGDPVEVYGEVIGAEPIPASVLRVYPAGFTKISSLGVEQQRVKVITKLDERPERLGTGFRVYVRIYYAEAADALILPRTAIFRGPSGDWQVMAVREGRTELRQVVLGILTDDKAQILEGLASDARVVAYPSRDVVAGMRVETDPAS